MKKKVKIGSQKQKKMRLVHVDCWRKGTKGEYPILNRILK